jgi:hypothetical protein
MSDPPLVVEGAAQQAMLDCNGFAVRSVNITHRMLMLAF